MTTQTASSPVPPSSSVLASGVSFPASTTNYPVVSMAFGDGLTPVELGNLQVMIDRLQPGLRIGDYELVAPVDPDGDPESGWTVRSHFDHLPNIDREFSLLDCLDLQRKDLLKKSERLFVDDSNNVASFSGMINAVYRWAGLSCQSREAWLETVLSAPSNSLRAATPFERQWCENQASIRALLRPGMGYLEFRLSEPSHAEWGAGWVLRRQDDQQVGQTISDVKLCSAARVAADRLAWEVFSRAPDPDNRISRVLAWDRLSAFAREKWVTEAIKIIAAKGKI